jgi:LEA14-like dessication related protein
MKTLLALGVIGWLVCGCGSSTPGPSVDLVSVRFEDATALETTATFTLRLSNENPAPVQINGAVHKIYVNGLYLGKGLSDQTVEVPRLGTITNDVTVYINNLKLATRFKSIIETKAFEYRIASVFHGSSRFGRTRSESSGKLELKDFLPDLEETNAPAAELPPASAHPTNSPESP